MISLIADTPNAEREPAMKQKPASAAHIVVVSTDINSQIFPDEVTSGVKRQSVSEQRDTGLTQRQTSEQ